MGKHLHITQDERGFYTLQLPKPTLFGSFEPQKFHLDSLFRLWHRLNKRRLAFAFALSAGSIWLVFTLLFFVPSRLNFSVAGDTCGFNPMFLPRLSRHASSGGFTPVPSGGLRIAGYPVLSLKTCLEPTSAPVAGQKQTAKITLFHLPFLQKNIAITPLELPTTSARLDPGKAVSASSLLLFDLSSPDKVFGYKIKVGETASDCITTGAVVSCNLSSLGLAQGASYALALDRTFNGEPAGEVTSVSIQTLDPVIITASSIGAGATVFDKPTGLSLTTNKALQSLGEATLIRSDNGTVVPVTASLTDTVVNLSFGTELERSAPYVLKLSALVATDGSELVTPYELGFTTSGGPKVTGASIGSSRVQPDSNAVLTFDAALLPGQTFQDFAHIEIAGKKVAAAVTASGNKLTINPSVSLPRCTAFKVVLVGGLINEHGVGGGEAYSMNSRTICQEMFSIGRSVQGRSISAYRFGSGSSKIVFVGGMHGNEKSSVATMNAFIDYLEDHAGEIPAHRSIIIIPNHNPDGYASSRRTNANTVDLNRNFPSNDWSSSVQMPGGQNLPQGGGITPLDQPESAALASFIQSQQPRLVLTYHAVARVVISNDAGDSVTLAQNYARDSGYPFTSNADSHGTFEYATTGEFEDWLADKEGITGILIELSSMSANQFSTHRAAIWNLVQLP